MPRQKGKNCAESAAKEFRQAELHSQKMSDQDYQTTSMRPAIMPQGNNSQFQKKGTQVLQISDAPLGSTHLADTVMAKTDGIAVQCLHPQDFPSPLQTAH